MGYIKTPFGEFVVAETAAAVVPPKPFATRRFGKPKKSASKPAKEETDFEDFRLRLLLLSNQEPPEPAPPDETPKHTAMLNDLFGGRGEVVKSIKLYYTNPSENSDKVYNLFIVKEPKFINTFYVDFSYGRRGKTLKEGRKTKIAVSHTEASRIFDSFVEEKRKEGYTENVSGRPFSR